VSEIGPTNELKVRVADNGGMGIPEEMLDNRVRKVCALYLPLARVAPGLGLPIAKSIIELHGGSIVTATQSGLTGGRGMFEISAAAY
jgi:signal transduction histidine kinase